MSSSDTTACTVPSLALAGDLTNASDGGCLCGTHRRPLTLKVGKRVPVERVVEEGSPCPSSLPLVARRKDDRALSRFHMNLHTTTTRCDTATRSHQTAKRRAKTWATIFATAISLPERVGGPESGRTKEAMVRAAQAIMVKEAGSPTISRPSGRLRQRDGEAIVPGAARGRPVP